MMQRWCTAVPAAAVMLVACSPQASRNEVEPVPEANVVEAESTGNAQNEVEAASKSILRPEVTETEPAEPVIEPIEETVPFGTSGTVLDDAGRAVLDTILASRALRAGGPVTLRGHSDSRGHDGDNLVVSGTRARAVAAYLEQRGVAKDRITVIALGEARPIAPNAQPNGEDDPAGRARNRRVEVSVALPPPPPEAATDPAARPQPTPSATPAALRPTS
jgi:outer membrane protein OmpA-like peptidoglycan-associated protein